MTSPPRRLALVGTSLALCTVCVLVAVDGTWAAWLALPAVAAPLLPRRAAHAAVGWLLVVLVLALADVALVLLDRDTLGQRLAAATTHAARQVSRTDELVPDPCARYRLAEGVVTDGPPRDALGRQVFAHGDRSTRVLVVGDSVLHLGFARALHEALAEAGIGHVVSDTSVYGYDWHDEACLLTRDLPDGPWDLVIVGLVLNDLPIPDFAELDLGAGRALYDVWSLLPEDLAPFSSPPLLVDPRNPHVHARRDALRARWGDRLRLGWSDASTLTQLLDGPVPADKHGVDALHRATRRVAEAGVPAAWLVFPMLYDADPNPLDPLIDAHLRAVVAGGATPTDLRATYAGLRAEHLGRGFAATDTPGRGTWDPIHPSPAALRLAADAALAAVPALAAARPILLDRAAARLPCARWTCTAHPAPAPGADGVLRPTPPCVPDRPPTCPGSP